MADWRGAVGWARLGALLAGAGNDWQKDRQFRKLNSERDAVKVKVVRAGKQVGAAGVEAWGC